MDAQRLASDRQVEDLRRAVDDNSQMRRSLLELQSQIESLRGEIARLHGQNEQLLRDLAEIQRRQKDIVQGVDERLRKVEPSKVSVDGKEFIADPNEAREFEAALAIFRRGRLSGGADGLRRIHQALSAKRLPSHGAVLAGQFAVRQPRLPRRHHQFPRLAGRGARTSARGRGGAVDRQLPDRAEGQPPARAARWTSW